jgi:transcriptional regulator with XRE-family HTH domain
MTDTRPDLARFGAIVKARREELGLRQDQLSDRGGPSTTTLTKVENASGVPADVTIRKLDVALRWQPGSARRTLHGGEPEVVPANVSYEAPEFDEQSTAITRMSAEQAFLYLDDVVNLLELLSDEDLSASATEAADIVHSGTMALVLAVAAGVPGARAGQLAANRLGQLSLRLSRILSDEDRHEGNSASRIIELPYRLRPRMQSDRSEGVAARDTPEKSMGRQLREGQDADAEASQDNDGG